MKQQSVRKPFFRMRNIFWLIFIAFFVTGTIVIVQECRATLSANALIKELKSRSFHYALQLQEQDKIKELFPIIAATGNLMDAHFSPLTNTMEIAIKNVDPRICQKIMRSDYDEPLQIIVNNQIANRKETNCLTGKPVQMAFYYTVRGRDSIAGRLTQMVQSGDSINTALETATSDTKSVVVAVAPDVSDDVEAEQTTQMAVVAPSVVNVSQPVVQPTVQVANTSGRSLLRPIVRRQVFAGETLGDVVSADKKRKALNARVVRVTNDIYVSASVATQSQPQPMPISATPAKRVLSIDEILAQDMARHTKQYPQSVNASMPTPLGKRMIQQQKNQWTTYPSAQTTPPVGVRAYTPQVIYQRPVYHDTMYVSRTAPTY